MNWLRKMLLKLLNGWAKVSTPKPPEWPAGGTEKPQDTGCQCNRSGPLAMPWNGSELANAGNSQECPVYGGRDIRFVVYRENGTDSWLIARPFEHAIEFDGNKFRIKCPTYEAHQYHVIGYSHNKRGAKPEFPVTSDGWMPYVCTTFVYAECRKLP